jgi:hypothetical protein
MLMGALVVAAAYQYQVGYVNNLTWRGWAAGAGCSNPVEAE